MLVNVVGRGGNVLLNVGPDRDGVIPPSHVDILRQVGHWLGVNGKGFPDVVELVFDREIRR